MISVLFRPLEVGKNKMSKVSGDTLRESITSVLEGSKTKQRKFKETIELQVPLPHIIDLRCSCDNLMSPVLEID